MTLDSDAKFEEKLFFGLKSNMRNLETFIRVLVSLKMETVMEFFSPKLKIFELKIYKGVMCHENEERCEIQEKLTCQFKIGMSNTTNFDSRTQKSKKIAL